MKTSVKVVFAALLCRFSLSVFAIDTLTSSGLGYGEIYATHNATGVYGEYGLSDGYELYVGYGQAEGDSDDTKNKAQKDDFVLGISKQTRLNDVINTRGEEVRISLLSGVYYMESGSVVEASVLMQPVCIEQELYFCGEVFLGVSTDSEEIEPIAGAQATLGLFNDKGGYTPLLGFKAESTAKQKKREFFLSVLKAISKTEALGGKIAYVENKRGSLSDKTFVGPDGVMASLLYIF